MPEPASAGERIRTSTLFRAHGSEPCLSTSSSTPAEGRILALGTSAHGPAGQFGHNVVGVYLYGGSGPDLIKGGADRDAALGQSGRDKLKGGRGKDSLLGGPGRDIIDGGPGRDVCSSGYIVRDCEH